jgi:hypothetical protein
MTTKKLKTEKQIKMAYFDQKPFSRSNSRSKLSKRAITPKDVTLKEMEFTSRQLTPVKPKFKEFLFTRKHSEHSHGSKNI